MQNKECTVNRSFGCIRPANLISIKNLVINLTSRYQTLTHSKPFFSVSDCFVVNCDLLFSSGAWPSVCLVSGSDLPLEKIYWWSALTLLGGKHLHSIHHQTTSIKQVFDRTGRNLQTNTEQQSNTHLNQSLLYFSMSSFWFYIINLAF